MNHASLRFDARSLLKTKMSLPAFKFLRHFEVLEVGRTRPAYSKFMLNGVMLNGVNLGVRVSWFYTAFAYGNSLQQVESNKIWMQQPRQRMIFGRLGFGNKDFTFIHFSVLHAKEDPASLQADPQYYLRPPDTLIHIMADSLRPDTFYIPADTIQITRKPSESLVCGLEGGVSFFKGKWKVQGEVSGCVNTANTESEELNIDQLPAWVKSVHQPRISTSLSYAWRIVTQVALRNTSLNASVNRVEPGYKSPGLPYMRQDYLSFELQGNQSLFKRKIAIQPWMRMYSDNLSGIKSYTTQTIMWGLTTSWRPVKLPYMSVTWAPNRQVMFMKEGKRENRAELLTVSSGKNYLINNKFRAYTGITWSNQKMKMNGSEAQQKYLANNITLQQTLMMKIPVSINASAGYYHQNYAENLRQSLQLTLGGQYYLKKNLNAGLGLRYMGQFGSGNRIGILGSLMADFNKFGRLNISVEPLFYRDILTPERDYDQYIIRFSFINKIEFKHERSVKKLQSARDEKVG